MINQHNASTTTTTNNNNNNNNTTNHENSSAASGSSAIVGVRSDLRLYDPGSTSRGYIKKGTI